MLGSRRALRNALAYAYAATALRSRPALALQRLSATHRHGPRTRTPCLRRLRDDLADEGAAVLGFAFESLGDDDLQGCGGLKRHPNLGITRYVESKVS